MLVHHDIVGIDGHVFVQVTRLGVDLKFTVGSVSDDGAFFRIVEVFVVDHHTISLGIVVL
ncbi:hypothetical protein ACFQL1_23635 [Halomicroarcula sp. GCM10025709]|uniref:hypothetical protein n=1 Tax=Halomicroarcula sp. GCM10025709 TaxID=3252669 RepID=UPI0036065B89